MSEQQLNATPPFDENRSPDTPATPEPKSQAPDRQQDQLPAEARDLPDGARNIFQAAFSSAQNNGLDQQAALQVAWNTVKHDYQQGSDGKWQSKGEEPGIHNKPITTGGN